LLHFTGRQLYGPKRFINEAKRLGVQRVVPFNMLFTLEWGQPILLAEYKTVESKLENGKTEKIPTAGVYAYFNIKDLSYWNMAPQVRERLLSKLHVEKVSDGGGGEARACGSYGVGAVYATTNTIKEIAQAIALSCKELSYETNLEIAKEHDLDKIMSKEDFEAHVQGMSAKWYPAMFKYFLRGPIKVLTAPAVLYNEKFVRTYKYIDSKQIKERIEKDGDLKHAIIEVKGYTLRKYLNKKDRAKLDNVMLTEFVESTT
jgi:hypothetical protein